MATYIHFPEKSGIYQIVNNITQRRYIGYASSIRQRLKGHVFDLSNNKHANDYLQKSWNKYGAINFTLSVLQECSKDELCLLEDYWVKVLKTTDREFGYNLKDTDPNGKPGCAEETKAKLRISNKGKRPSDFCLSRRLEVKTSEEGKKRILDSRKDIDFTKLHRKKRGKQILDSSTGIIYSSLAELCEIIKVTKGSMSRKLLGKRNNKTTYNYI